MKLSFVGDVRLIPDRTATPGTVSLSPFDRVQSLLGDPDVLSANLECFFTHDLTNEQGHWKHAKVLRADPAMCGTLVDAGFDVVNLANNHIMDGGLHGLEVSTQVMDQQGLCWVGAGRNLKEAIATKFVKRNGVTIAFLSGADFSEDYATESKAGIAPAQPLSSFLQRTKAASEAADLVVVQLHADLEFSEAPAPYRVRLSRQLIDHGAHLVIQHHPHVVQGVEEYGGGLIAYSLGNFVFNVHGNPYQSGYPEARYGWILSVDVDHEAKEPRLRGWNMEPVWIAEDHRPAPPGPERRAQALVEFHRRCDLLKDGRAVRLSWRQRSWREARYHALMAYYKTRQGKPLAAMGDLIDLPLRPRNRHWILGFLGLSR
ncbi:CapA family protein [Thioalkalivibrio sp. ALJ1]|uniref:CapA family protein n=1 Tax=Thioalkalivibrio sp. ALJ1 TaxID=1158144 RepID=UPI001FCC89C5|nr:CapA family protein [Thioalkalivibrio sp. ALJ1]